MEIWDRISGRYAVIVVIVRIEFYEITENDPSYTNRKMPTINKCSKLTASNYLTEALDPLNFHNMTNLKKEVDTINERNIENRYKNWDRSTNGN